MATMKTGGDGQQYPAAAWLYVPDPSAPTTWKLRYKEFVDGKLKVTRKILGMALAALTKGFRGSKVQIPDGIKKRLISRVNSMIASVSEQAEVKPEVFQEWTEGAIYDTFEEVSFEPGSIEVDRENGVLKNIAMLGLISKNKRVYDELAVVDAIKRGVYEGLPCYKDHNGGKPRSIDDAIGRWINTRWDETTRKARGDLHTLKHFRDRVIDFFDNGPTLAAPSHVVEGKVQRVKNKDGVVVERVTHISKGISVDLVAGAATVNSLKESGNENNNKQEVKKVKNEGNISENEMKNYFDENGEFAKLTEQIGELTKMVSELKAENEKLKSDREAAEKLAASRSYLTEALSKTILPEKARSRVYEENKNTIRTRDEVDGLVKMLVSFVTDDCGVKLAEVKVDIPTDEKKPTEKKLTLSEAFLKRQGFKKE